VTIHNVHDAKVLKHLISLARSPHTFLSLYMPIDLGQTTPESLHTRLRDALDQVERHVEATKDPNAHKAFCTDRQRVEQEVEGLRPDGLALAVFSAQEIGTLIAYWLPRPVRDVHAHYGQGALVLPLLDMLDEFEPVALALVEKESARVMVFEAGILESDERFSYSIVPYSAPGAAEKKARGHENKELAQEFQTVVEALEKRHDVYPFRRLFLSGTNDVVSLFKTVLPAPLLQVLAGDVALDVRAPDNVIQGILLKASEEMERRQEEELVEGLVTRAHKNDRAVIGLADTLDALNQDRVQLLVLTMDVPDGGRRCEDCHALLAADSPRCPVCGGRSLADVSLQAELPLMALRQSADIEVVHGPAAQRLGALQSIGALTRFTT